MATDSIVEQTSVIIPALNEEATVEEVVRDLRQTGSWYEILVVDDGSSDRTAARASAAGARVIRQPYRKGNGAAVKAGLRAATGQFVLIMDADGQHRPADARRLVGQLEAYDLVVGTRSPDSQAGLARRAGNAVLNGLASYLAEQQVADLTSGFRAARRSLVMDFIHLMPNGFSTPTTTTLAFLRAGYSVRFEPIEVSPRSGESRSKISLSSDGGRFVLMLLKVVTLYSPLRVFLPMSAAAFVLGAGYAVWTIWTQSHVTNSSVLLIVVSVLILLIGLVSEQIAALRVEISRPPRGPHS
jgi:glycosyltransferase involved in cell wall biosynthesis